MRLVDRFLEVGMAICFLGVCGVRVLRCRSGRRLGAFRSRRTDKLSVFEAAVKEVRC
jgi:hypothetical protein